MRLRQANRLVADLDRVLTADDIMSLEASDVLASRVFLKGKPALALQLLSNWKADGGVVIQLVLRLTNSRWTLSKREIALSRREISAVRPGRRCSTLDLPHLRDVGRGPRFGFGVEFAPNFLGGWNDLEDS